jgi:2-haloacid dehalogenase
MLDTVVFDLGGVLIEWDPRHLYRDVFAGDEETMEWFLAEVATGEWNHAMDAGRPFAEASAELIAAHPEYAPHIRAWGERQDEMLAGPIAGTVALLDELRRTDVRLLALTNWSAENFPAAVERFDFLSWFEGIVVSGEHGLAKPDPALFHVLLDTHLVVPARTAFIDDRADNVAAASALGLTGVLFTSPETLADDLVRLGLLPTRP